MASSGGGSASEDVSIPEELRDALDPERRRLLAMRMQSNASNSFGMSNDGFEMPLVTAKPSSPPKASRKATTPLPRELATLAVQEASISKGSTFSTESVRSIAPQSLEQYLDPPKPSRPSAGSRPTSSHRSVSTLIKAIFVCHL
eukprot:m.219417 g.219417  ORF g.219417 m.219417 type:complete len:144 (-) comp15110_c0_seq20:1861-2292(-)